MLYAVCIAVFQFMFSRKMSTVTHEADKYFKNVNGTSERELTVGINVLSETREDSQRVAKTAGNTAKFLYF